MNIFKTISLVVMFLSLTACGYQTSQIRVGETHTEVRAAHVAGFELVNAIPGTTADVSLFGGGLVESGIPYGSHPRQILVKPALIGGAETMNVTVQVYSGDDLICSRTLVLQVSAPYTWTVYRPNTRYVSNNPSCESSITMGARKRDIVDDHGFEVGGVRVEVGIGYGGSARRKGPKAWEP